MRKYLVWFLAFTLHFAPFTSHVAWAAVDSYINYQGRLTDTGGKAVSGSLTMTFRLYDASTSGTKVWSEDQTVTITEADSGIFNVVLGSVSALSSVDFNVPLWLSVQISGDSEMTPRQRLTPAGQALNADKVDGLDSASFMRADTNTSTSGKITITRSGTGLVITPTTNPVADTKLVDVQNASGTTKFSVDLEGDVAVAGDLAVTGTVSGSIATTGTTSSTWIVDSDNTSGTEPADGAGLKIEGGSGDVSLLWDATNDEMDVNKTTNVTGTLKLSGSTSGYVGFAPAAAAGSTTYTLPSADATASGQVLSSNASGTLSWATVDTSASDDAPTDASYLTLAANSGLSAERVLTEGNYLDLTDAGAGSTLTVAMDPTEVGSVTWGSANATWTFAATSGTNPTVGWSGSALDVDATVTVDDLACETAGCLSAAELGTDSVDSDEIAAGAVGSSELASSGVTANTYGSATAVPRIAVDADGRITSATDTTIAITGSNLTADSLDFTEFIDAMTLDADTTIDMKNGSTNYDLVLDDMSSGALLQLQNAQSTADTATFYVNDTSTANAADLVITPSDGGIIIDTTGTDADGSHSGVDLASSGGSPALDNVTDARDSLAIAVDPTAADSDGVIKLGRNGSAWEYIWYDNDARSDAGEFVFSASSRVESSSPAYLLFSPPTSSGSTPGNRYGIKFDPEVTPKTISFVEISNPTTTPVENTLFEMKAGGKMGLEFVNLVKNGSFEAFSAMETFVDSAVTGGTGGAGSNYQGGWSNFAPDEWTWLSGKIFQNAPLLFTPSTTITATNLQQDFYHGKSSVALQDTATGSTYTTTNDGTIASTITNDGAIKQTLKDLKPNTIYSVGVKAMVSNATNTTAKLNLTGEDSAAASQLTPVGQSAAGELSTASTSFTDLAGTFKTSSTAGEVILYLICQQTGTPAATDVCRFDAAQVVAAKSLPEFAPNSITDTGDQTLYGSLRMGRTSDDRGGILSVDKSVRTRAIEFFEKDPGMSGTTGGFGGVSAATKTISGSGSTITMTTSGTFYGANPREFKITLNAGSPPTTFKYEYRECFPSTGCTGTLTTGNSSLALTSYTSAAELTPSGSAMGSAGAKVLFTSTSGGVAGDEWSFTASGMNMAAQYNSYSGTSTYTPGQTRIFKDPTTQKLTFQDGTTYATLSDIVGVAGNPAYVGYPSFFPASGGGGQMYLNTSQGYTNSAQRTFDVEIQGNDGATGRDTFRWRDNAANGGGAAADWDVTGIVIPSGGGPYTMNYAGTVNYVFTITFGSPAGTYADGNVGDRWTFTAYPSTTSQSVKTITGGQGIGVSGTGDTRTINFIDCAANQVLKRNAGDTDWACAADENSGGTGTITQVTAGAGLTGGGASGAVTVDVVGGTGITANANDVAFDATELGDLTFGAGGAATMAHTFSLSGATDPVWTIGNNSMDLTTGALKVGGTAVLTSETDPQVGTLTNAKWCTTDGSAVNCTSNAPVTNTTGVLPIEILAADATAPPASSIMGNTPTADFADDADDIAYFTLRVPDNVDTSQPMTLKLNYVMSTGNTGNVVMAMAYEVVADDGDATPAAFTATKSDTLDPPDTAELLDVFSGTNLKIDAGDLGGAGRNITCKFYRDADHASDTHTGLFKLLNLWLVYTKASS